MSETSETSELDFSAHFAGESDTPADREPLALLEGYELADNTGSETGEGEQDFSWSSCEGCGSTLGGSRHRLALFTPTERVVQS